MFSLKENFYRSQRLALYEIYINEFKLFFTLLNISCKEISCEGCKENNKPPIAIAGPTSVITLSTDSIWMAQNPPVTRKGR